MEKNEKHEIAKEALKALSEIEESTRIEELVKDNKIEFIVADKTYRVRKPVYAERIELDTTKRKKYVALVKDDSFLFRKQWIEQYKKKGIDIVEMENKVRTLDGEIKNILLRLAKSQEPKDVASLKEQVLKLQDEQFNTSIEVTDLLSNCIEQQILIYVNAYTTYLVLEVKEGETWKRLFNSYSEFEESESKIIQKAYYYINMLIYSVGLSEEK